MRMPAMVFTAHSLARGGAVYQISGGRRSTVSGQPLNRVVALVRIGQRAPTQSVSDTANHEFVG
jgi:hypothetical protein